tara:strand:+ start:205 stop:699 length:495 start_codon:yes stop_codon:yes gene_type:complete
MMKKILRYVLVVGCVSAGAVPALAVPVVPNFQQGSMTSHTETESTVTETINSIDYRTGWEYSVTGVGVSNNGQALNPPVNTSTVTVTPSSAGNGSAGGVTITGAVTSSFDQLDFSQANNFTITNPGEAFQFTQTYQGPGITNQTVIQRVTNVKSVTDTTSTFTQ